ncbi:hypothetical protein BBJ28_00017839 [Nothophytophthora sp. Chile5]|nr:hypothetical protein BBJ28_00017839 [Nothophytophthora sp. Chile5]
MPNDTVNRVMDTESFDSGSFWLLVDQSSALVVLATFGLAVVALSYLFILVTMAFRRKSKQEAYVPQSPTSKLESMKKRVEKALDDAATKPKGGKVSSSAVKLAASLARDGSSTRKIIVRFDLLIAVGYPMLVLFYCFSTFSFDRAKFAINLDVFPPGWFEQGASVIADPVQTAVIYKTLKSLRIASVLDFFTRVGVNATLCFRFHYVVKQIQDPRKQQSSVYPKRHRAAAALFAAFAALLVVFVEESIRTSTLACQPHPECAVNARRWTFLESDSMVQCPCLILIDRDIGPKTFAEWEQPKNVTDKVAQLAAMGELQTLQLTNRYLPVLPDELRRCTEMQHLHLESKFTSPVVILPDDMFEDMGALTFIHFAAFIPMTRLPSFRGLTNLKSLTLAVFLFLEELPAFDTLPNLERLVLASVPPIDSLPDFPTNKKLKSFAASDRGTWCCNGFLGVCDLQNPLCGVHPLWGTPAATCLPANRTEKVASASTLAAVEQFADTVCGAVLQPGVLEGPPSEELMAPCNGTLYRQCKELANGEAMCYNARFMAVACTTNAFPIEMRRRQIAQGVGDPCDPEIEAWLGCK